MTLQRQSVETGGEEGEREVVVSDLESHGCCELLEDVAWWHQLSCTAITDPVAR